MKTDVFEKRIETGFFEMLRMMSVPVGCMDAAGLGGENEKPIFAEMIKYPSEDFLVFRCVFNDFTADDDMVLLICCRKCARKECAFGNFLLCTFDSKCGDIVACEMFLGNPECLLNGCKEGSFTAAEVENACVSFSRLRMTL